MWIQKKLFKLVHFPYLKCCLGELTKDWSEIYTSDWSMNSLVNLTMVRLEVYTSNRFMVKITMDRLEVYTSFVHG